MWTTVKLASIHCIYVNELQKKEVKDFSRRPRNQTYSLNTLFKLPFSISSIHHQRKKTFVTPPIFLTR